MTLGALDADRTRTEAISCGARFCPCRARRDSAPVSRSARDWWREGEAPIETGVPQPWPRRGLHVLRVGQSLRVSAGGTAYVDSANAAHMVAASKTSSSPSASSLEQVHQGDGLAQTGLGVGGPPHWATVSQTEREDATVLPRRDAPPVDDAALVGAVLRSRFTQNGTVPPGKQTAAEARHRHAGHHIGVRLGGQATVGDGIAVQVFSAAL